VSIVVHVASKVLRVPLELVEVCISTKCWSGHPRLFKKKKKIEIRLIILGLITVNPPVVWPVLTLPTRGLKRHFTYLRLKTLAAVTHLAHFR
jgi:hypothetical protein